MRAVRVGVSWQLLFEMLTEGWKIEHCECIKGLPNDAEYVRGYTRELGGVVEKPDVFLVFTHDSFADIEPGEVIPEFTPEFQIKSPEEI
jgi:hypothetical protein